MQSRRKYEHRGLYGREASGPRRRGFLSCAIGLGRAVICSPMRRGLVTLLVIALLCLWGNAAVWGISPSETQGAQTTVRIGVRAHSGSAEAVRKWGPTADYLSRTVPGHTFELAPLVGFEEMRTAVKEGNIDFVATNPAAYAELEARFGVARIATLRNLRVGKGFVEFGAVIFVRSDRTDIRDLNDVAGKSIMGVHAEAFGGWQMALRELKDLGVDLYADCQNVSFAPGMTQEEVVQAVIDGSVDVGTVRTGMIEKMVRRGQASPGAVRVLAPVNDEFPLPHTTRLYPEWPFAKASQTSDALAQKVAIALMQMSADDPAAVAGGYTGWTVPQDYADVHELLKELRAGPYEDYGEISFGDFLRRYWLWLVLGLLGFLASVAVTAYVLRLNRRLARYGRQLQREIAERKRIEDETLSLERHVQQAQKLESLGVLAGGIAHDFNNILTAILGNAELALAGLPPYATACGNIREIQKASQRAAELSKQMLAYSGKGRFVVEPIDLGKFVGEMTHLLDASISKKAVLKYDFIDNLPTIKGDATQIRQVVMNLISNASEAIGDKDGVIAVSTGVIDCDRAHLDSVDETLRVGLGKPLPEGAYVYLEVADDGCGMDAETTKKIFDPFFTTKFTGRGLGMAAVLGIVRGHDGAIKIHSEPGKGSTFRVLFPASEPADSSDPILARDAVQSQAWRSEGTVLIVDDEQSVCDVGEQMLSMMGFGVLTAADGCEAVEIFRDRADEIDCVLLDLTMPHMGGEEALGELRRIREDVTVILCSGYSEQDVSERFTGKGLAGFIQKPYNMAALREKLMTVLPGRKT